ncbi:hypothetical protein F5890DRAFT_1559853 [Lentinula detonsa]|uniref:Uncharacterized protein n=1 Tax=Lentinula detonsa TaxID=2804962 RepID=A0AA38PN67_9AGAR|nr:hypothetical protein F5890DRAFT_1559853 [Lentinula detonsa]
MSSSYLLVPSLVPICVNRSSLLSLLHPHPLRQLLWAAFLVLLKWSVPQPNYLSTSSLLPVAATSIVDNHQGSCLSPLASAFIPSSQHPFPLPFDDIITPHFNPSPYRNTDPCINGLPPRSPHPT